MVVVGATSTIATATLYHFLSYELCLIGRNQERLESMRKDLEARGAKRVSIILADVGDSNVAKSLHSRIVADFGDYDNLFVAHGSLPVQEDVEASYDETYKVLEVNFLSVIAILTDVANYFEDKKRGTIAVICSVAGDRGRKSNYIYGTAKGALEIFLQGLRNRLDSHGVGVLTIKPGFVDTPMTSGIKKGILFASPEKVGAGIAKAIYKGRDVVYLPWFWKVIMMIICSIPERIFKKMSL
jgi:short-subunit dehydrogenase